MLPLLLAVAVPTLAAMRDHRRVLGVSAPAAAALAATIDAMPMRRAGRR